MAKIVLKNAGRYVAPNGHMFLKDRVEKVSMEEAALLLADTTERNGLKLRLFRLLGDAVPTTAEVERQEALELARQARGSEDDIAQDVVMDADLRADTVGTAGQPSTTAVPDDDMREDAPSRGVMTLDGIGESSQQ